MPEESTNPNQNPPAAEGAETKAEAAPPAGEAPVTETPATEAPAAETPKVVEESETKPEPTPVTETAATPEIPSIETTAEPEVGPESVTPPAQSAPAAEPTPAQNTPAPASPSPSPSQPANLQNLLAKAKAKIAERRQKSLDKILAALAAQSKLSNQQLRKITKKSNATVFRYMNILEKQGQVRQVGKTGKYTYYELVK